MLIKLSLRNLKRSFQDYTIYFFTLILGIAIFYMFNSIESQTVMLRISSSTKDMIQFMLSILSGVSVFVSFILAFLIIYATRFLMKRRNKEFAIYLTLGMSKRQISSLVLYETFCIGLLSLVVGLLIGVGLSQIMSIFVAGMFEVDMTDFEFVFSSSAMMKTIVYFVIIYVIVMILNVFFIGKQELIDLLMSHRKNETMKMKNLWVCSIMFIVSVVMLSYAYYLVTLDINHLTDEKILLAIALGIVSTFMIFYSLSGFVLKVLMSQKSLYYRNLNTFITRQLSSQMNTTVFSMGMICLMLFMTICVLSSGITIKDATTNQIKELTPVDVNIYKNWDNEGKQFTKEEMIASHQSVEERLEKIGFSTHQYLKEIYSFNTYATNDLLFKDTLGNMYHSISQEYPFMRFDRAECIVKLSDYNMVARSYGKPTYTLHDNQYMIISNFTNISYIRDKALLEQTSIKLLGKTYYPKYSQCQDGYILISANKSNSGIIIVPDSAVNDSIRQQNVMIANYKANDQFEKEKIEEKILVLKDDTHSLNITTKMYLYNNSVGLGAMVTFIAIYLGIIFLISSAALLALKQLSESADNKERYQMLRKIGVDEKMLNHSLLMQIVLFFMIPLVLAIIHSLFGIKFCQYVLETFGTDGLFLSICLTALFIILIYGGYMMITYYNGKRTIRDA